MKWMIVGLLVSVLWLVAASGIPANAHSPYTREVKTLPGPNGEALVFEKLYGDGIVSADPVRLQVVNRHGAVVAFTPTALEVGLICPSIKNCLAYTYTSSSVWVELYSLDYQHLDFNRRDAVTERMEYPEYEDKPVGFKPSSSLIVLLSPLLIIKDFVAAYLVLFYMCFAPFWLFANGWRLWPKRRNELLDPQPRITFPDILFAILYLIFLAGVFLIIGLTIAAPMAYSLFIMAMSILMGILWIKQQFRKYRAQGQAELSS